MGILKETYGDNISTYQNKLVKFIKAFIIYAK